MLLNLWPKKHPVPPLEGALPLMPPCELLAPHRRDLEIIRQLAGVPAAHWERLYLAMFRAFAAFVQQLPASEAHHHAGPGGLLAHGLEVTREALKLRRGHLLPAGAAVETVAAQQDLWTYATATAALLHDLGKPISDQHVARYGEAGEPLGAWVPWLGPMSADVAWYHVTFVRERVYKRHQKLPPLLAHLIVPPTGMGWIGSDADVLGAWLDALGGDHEAAGVLGAIVHQADGLSVATNLTGAPAQMPTARTRPLHQRLLTALRYLLDQGQLPLNRKGAAGWRTETDLWLVSKRALDALREHLAHEGQGGVPTRNERLMDELQQHRVLVANGERAIWTVEVTVEDWSQTLTTLRFPVCTVWPEADARPEPFAGSVTPVERNGAVVDPPSAAGSDPRQRTPSSPVGAEDDGSPAPDVQGTASVPAPPVDEPAISVAARAQTAAETVAEANDDAGTRFVEWLREGLETGRLAVNETRARVHTAAEGLLLVSPAIFKDFDPQAWSTVQKRFQKLGLHRKTDKGTNIFCYQVQGARKRSRIRVYLVPDPVRVLPGIDLPPPNPHLSLLE